MAAILQAINDGNLELILSSILVAILLLVKIINTIGFPSRLIPLIAIVLGCIFSIVYLGENSIKNGILIGLWLGFASVGLYSTAQDIFSSSNDTKKSLVKSSQLNLYYLKDKINK